VVFNCPAVHGCLGWKLGEYLALGKAIISIPLERALPEPLEHGEHIHYVDDNTEAMSEAVRTIDRDADYRHHLESGARSWYERNLTPAKIAARLVDEPLL
jgi:glycosyltransferase involved in cell wall biosynthesis